MIKNNNKNRQFLRMGHSGVLVYSEHTVVYLKNSMIVGSGFDDSNSQLKHSRRQICTESSL